ncbi:MAG: hypothetical protein QOH50_956 [Kribbellaceae bacterium]|jgi:hypothetical protein|nr:hypothetical protein [Kribbellaceae bacterium]
MRNRLASVLAAAVVAVPLAVTASAAPTTASPAPTSQRAATTPNKPAGGVFSINCPVAPGVWSHCADALVPAGDVVAVQIIYPSPMDQAYFGLMVRQAPAKFTRTGLVSVDNPERTQIGRNNRGREVWAELWGASGRHLNDKVRAMVYW